MDNFVVFGRDAKGEEIHEIRESLTQIHEYISQLDDICFAKLWIKDRSRGQMIRWDLFMTATWYDTTVGSEDLLKDWFQAMAKVTG